MALNSGMSAKGLTAFFIISMPVISMAKPTMMDPALRRRPLLFRVRSIMPARATRGENTSGLSS